MINDPTINAVMDRIINAMGDAVPDDAACDALAAVLARRVVKLNPKIATGEEQALFTPVENGVEIHVRVYLAPPVKTA